MKKGKRYVPLYYTGINYVTMPDIRSESEIDAENSGILENRMARNREVGKGVGSIAGAGIGLGISALTGGAIPPQIAMGLGSQLGGIAGTAIGGNVGRKKLKNELERNKQRLLKEQNALFNVYKQDNDVVTNYLNTYSNMRESGMLNNQLTGMMYPVMANKGLISRSDNNLAELEKGELVFREDDNGNFKLVKDFSDAPTHKKGGVLTNLSVGDIVIPRNKRKEVEDMMDKNGRIIDKFSFNSLLYSLPINSNMYRDLGSGQVVKMYTDGTQNADGKKTINGSTLSYILPLVGMGADLITTLTDKSYKVGEDYAKSLMNEKAEIRDATYVKLDEIKYNDRSQPLRNKLNEQTDKFNSLAQNISGGSIQNLYNMYRNNLANSINKLQEIENQEGLRYDQIQSQNAQIRNQQELTNKQLYDQNVTFNEQNRARARDLRRLGLSTLYQLAALKNQNLRKSVGDNLKYLSDIQYNQRVKETESLFLNALLNKK